MKNYLEIGPGYGRLARELFRRTKPARYVGVELSAERCRLLSEDFKNMPAEFITGDGRTVDLSVQPHFDVVFSSSTMEHVRPDFGSILIHLRQFLVSGATVAFDFIRPAKQLDSDHTGVSGEFVRHYSDETLQRIARNSGYEVQGIEPFDMMNIDFSAQKTTLPAMENIDGVSKLKETTVFVHRKMLILKWLS
jgi:SAM-dependent methyltransferase